MLGGTVGPGPTEVKQAKGKDKATLGSGTRTSPEPVCCVEMIGKWPCWTAKETRVLRASRMKEPG